jgi:hypothetical protein
VEHTGWNTLACHRQAARAGRAKVDEKETRRIDRQPGQSNRGLSTRNQNARRPSTIGNCPTMRSNLSMRILPTQCQLKHIHHIRRIRRIRQLGNRRRSGSLRIL